ncbi:MAG: hypothetical protein IPP31_10610 [Chitinophagaceae bacterium]|nr:hypothetical protein [Chitinophagaceae bacterium]
MSATHSSPARMKKGIALFGLLFALVCFSGVFAQDSLFRRQDTTRFHIDPVQITIKEPAKPNPLLSETVTRPSGELMSWPNYPLTAQQIEQRDRINNRTVGQQIVHDVVETAAQSIINRKKNKRPAQVPRF